MVGAVAETGHQVDPEEIDKDNDRQQARSILQGAAAAGLRRKSTPRPSVHSRPRNGPTTISPIESLDRCALRRQQVEKRELLAGDAPPRRMGFADALGSRQRIVSRWIASSG
ncbi:hypothetical protein MMC29_005116, partial [Sticta canariensis]|nr:hypothetical protein [Sticta canariensis]